VPQLPADITPEDFADWDKMCAIVAGTEPVWAPGTAEDYHAWTFSWLVGETVRRATGATLSDVLADEIAKPLGVPHELFLKVPDDQLDRLAHLDDRNWAAAAAMLGGLLPNLDRVAPPKVRPDAELGNRRDLLRAEVAAVGTMSARAVARMYAAVLGEVDGVRLFSQERLDQAITPEPKSKDWVFGQEVTRGLGYSVEGERFGMGGMGGSLAYAFPKLGLSVAATKNRLAVAPRATTRWRTCAR
jgi:CubicO group peptidase (beta-lactamase class C family)